MSKKIAINNKRKYKLLNEEKQYIKDIQNQDLEATNYLLDNMIKQLQKFTGNQIKEEENKKSDNFEQIETYCNNSNTTQVPGQIINFFNNQFEDQHRNTSKAVKLDIFQNPQKVLRLQNTYILKNFDIVIEDYLLNPLQNGLQTVKETNINSCKSIQSNNISLEDQLETHSIFKDFKYIDYIIHENKYQKDCNKPEFMTVYFQDYNYQQSTQYFINRLLSFGNQRCKFYADQIQQLENIYKIQYQQFLQGENNNQQKKSFLEQNQINLQKILNKYKNQPVKIGVFRQFQNQRIADLQCISFNKALLNLLEYDTFDFEYDALKELTIPEHEYICNTQEYQNIFGQATQFFVNKQPIKQKLILPKNLLYLKTKRGKKIDNIEYEFQIHQEGSIFYLIHTYKLL